MHVLGIKWLKYFIFIKINLRGASRERSNSAMTREILFCVLRVLRPSKSGVKMDIRNHGEY